MGNSRHPPPRPWPSSRAPGSKPHATPLCLDGCGHRSTGRPVGRKRKTSPMSDPPARKITMTSKSDSPGGLSCSDNFGSTTKQNKDGRPRLISVTHPRCPDENNKVLYSYERQNRRASAYDSGKGRGHNKLAPLRPPRRLPASRRHLPRHQVQHRRVHERTLWDSVPAPIDGVQRQRPRVPRPAGHEGLQHRVPLPRLVILLLRRIRTQANRPPPGLSTNLRKQMSQNSARPPGIGIRTGKYWENKTTATDLNRNL